MDDYGKVYKSKEHHGLWRKRFIDLQNTLWADIPMTIVAVLSLFFIPLFQYCHDINLEGEITHNDEEVKKSKKLLKVTIWVNFIFSILFGLEIVMKSYAFGLRRAFSQCEWVVKLEFFYQAAIWLMWFFFVFKTYDHKDSYSLEVNVFSLGILLRSLRVTSNLNEIDLWRNFSRTIAALVKPFFNFSVTLYSLYMIYAALGQEIFGGKISTTKMEEMIILDPDI